MAVLRFNEDSAGKIQAVWRGYVSRRKTQLTVRKRIDFEDQPEEPVCIKSLPVESALTVTNQPTPRNKLNQSSSKAVSDPIEQSKEGNSKSKEDQPFFETEDLNVEEQFKRFIELQEENFKRFAGVMDKVAESRPRQADIQEKCRELRERGEMSLQCLKMQFSGERSLNTLDTGFLAALTLKRAESTEKDKEADEVKNNSALSFKEINSTKFTERWVKPANSYSAKHRKNHTPAYIKEMKPVSLVSSANPETRLSVQQRQHRQEFGVRPEGNRSA